MLIIDDNITNAAILKRMAARVFGGKIDIETSPREVIKACHEHHYDIIITDYMMPDLNGIELVKVLRCFTEYKQVPIIMTSACYDEAIISKARRSGVDDYITKPINLEQFRNKLTRFLSLRPTTYLASDRNHQKLPYLSMLTK